MPGLAYWPLWLSRVIISDGDEGDDSDDCCDREMMSLVKSRGMGNSGSISLCQVTP